MRRVIKEVAQAITSIVLFVGFLVIPFSLPIWEVVISTFPNATLLQHSFAFVIAATLALLSGIGALLALAVGYVFIIAIIINWVWVFLG